MAVLYLLPVFFSLHVLKRTSVSRKNGIGYETHTRNVDKCNSFECYSSQRSI